MWSLHCIKRILSDYTLIHERVLIRTSTIYALSSGLNGTGTALAVIRISGDQTLSGLTALTKKSINKIVSNPRKAILSDIVNPSTGELIDKGLVLWFPGPKSYTGEDTAELHVHGSRAIVSTILRLLGELPQFEPSKEGEFTRRAFLNGKMCLIEAEALSALIASQTDSQRRLAMKAMEGRISQLYDDWTSILLRSIAHLEATIDFGEDELIDENVLAQCKKNLTNLMMKINYFLNDASQRSELIRKGVNMAIIGMPNVGKSTLLNKLCQRDLSIVSPISGTTRDVIEGLLDIKGWTVRVCDTAGLKKTCIQDPIELEGIKRAKQRAEHADLVLLVMDGTFLVQCAGRTFSDFIEEFNDILDKDKPVIFVINKMDLLKEADINQLRELMPKNTTVSMISCKTEQSLDKLIDSIGDKISQLCGDIQNEDLFMTERHQTHLKRISQALEESLMYFDHDLAMAAYYLRQSIEEISNITGKISTEDILDVIFKEFCIGK